AEVLAEALAGEAGRAFPVECGDALVDRGVGRLGVRRRGGDGDADEVEGGSQGTHVRIITLYERMVNGRRRVNNRHRTTIVTAAAGDPSPNVSRYVPGPGTAAWSTPWPVRAPTRKSYRYSR